MKEYFNLGIQVAPEYVDSGQAEELVVLTFEAES